VEQVFAEGMHKIAICPLDQPAYHHTPPPSVSNPLQPLHEPPCLQATHVPVVQQGRTGGGMGNSSNSSIPFLATPPQDSMLASALNQPTQIARRGSVGDVTHLLLLLLHHVLFPALYHVCYHHVVHADK